MADREGNLDVTHAHNRHHVIRRVAQVKSLDVVSQCRCREIQLGVAPARDDATDCTDPQDADGA